MGDFGNAIKYLYTQFILRDVLSFITPGAMVVLTGFVLFLPGSCLIQRLDTLLGYSISMHWLLYVPLFGTFYLVGYAIQCSGRLIGIIRIHRLDRSTCEQRTAIFHCDWAEKPDYTWKEAREKVIDFLNATNGVEWARQYHERSVVLKQMCANGLLGIIIAVVFLSVNFCPWPYAKFFVVLPVTFLLVTSLLWGYRNVELGLETIEEKVLSIYRGRKLRKDNK